MGRVPRVRVIPLQLSDPILPQGRPYIKTFRLRKFSYFKSPREEEAVACPGNLSHCFTTSQPAVVFLRQRARHFCCGSTFPVLSLGGCILLVLPCFIICLVKHYFWSNTIPQVFEDFILTFSVRTCTHWGEAQGRRLVSGNNDMFRLLAGAGFKNRNRIPKIPLWRLQFGWSLGEADHLPC